MNAALRYLLAVSFINGIRSRIIRLRQPKYLFAAILGGAYFYFYFYRFLLGGQFMRGPQVVQDAQLPWLGSVMLMLAMLVFSWIIPASRAAIAFTEAEIAFLFPAPISRRSLIVHKLLKSQLTLLILAVMFTFLTGRFRAGSEAWFRMGGWWIILNTLSLHRIGASFALQRLRERGMADWKRRLGALFALAGLCAGFYALRNHLPPMPATPPGELPNYTAYAFDIASQAPVSYLLTPFRWLVQPYFARDAATFLATVGPALGIMILHAIWVVRADVSFEEAAITAAQNRAALISARERGEFRAKFTSKARHALWSLQPTGFPPTAFLWKAFLKFGGRRFFLLWLLLFAALAAAASVARQDFIFHREASFGVVAIVICGICYVTLLISLVTVGQQASAQLRQSMGSLDLVKTYPIPGWQIALGELLGTVTVGTLLQWGALFVAAFLISGLVGDAPRAMRTLLTTTASLAILLPAFNTATAILPSAAALMFPAWFKPRDATGPGIEQTGLRMMLGISQLLALAFALLPAAFFAVCAWFAVSKFALAPIWPATSALGIGALVLALEAGLGIAWLGHLYDRFDLSQTN